MSGNANFADSTPEVKGDICITDIKAREISHLCESDSGGNVASLFSVDLSENISEAWVCTTGKDDGASTVVKCRRRRRQIVVEYRHQFTVSSDSFTSILSSSSRFRENPASYSTNVSASSSAMGVVSH